MIAGLDSAPAYFGVTPCNLVELCISVKNTVSGVRVMPDPCRWHSTTWAGVSPSCPSSPQRQWKLEAEKPSRTTWHPGHHTPPYYFGVMSEVPVPGHK